MTTVTAQADPGTARSARTARTRDDIVTAAHRLFVEHGYRATSLRDVAAAAGISHPGLQRHFATKDALLAAVVESFHLGAERLLLDQISADEPGSLDFAVIAHHNAGIPGYLPLYAALTGEAATPSHPAHALMRTHFHDLIALSTDMIEESIDHDVVAADRDPRDESIRMIAAWDGLQLLSQYLPDRVEIIPALERHQEALDLPLGWRDPSDPEPAAEAVAVPPMPDFGRHDPAAPIGYQPGRDRRTRLVADAMTLFAREGYGDTSLRDIAQAAGVSKSTLLHHYRSKDELLGATLVELERLMFAQPSHVPAERAADELRSIPNRAALNAQVPDLVQLYSVLSCEALPAEHPAHAFFTIRYGRTIDYLTALLRAAQEDDDLPSHRDPEAEAIWLLALWEGLQYQWLYDPDSVDVATQLDAHLADLLPRD